MNEGNFSSSLINNLVQKWSLIITCFSIKRNILIFEYDNCSYVTNTYPFAFIDVAISSVF